MTTAIGYVHFLDLYHSVRAQRNHGTMAVLREAQRALRLAAAHFDHLYVPASSFFESELARETLAVHPLLVESGRISLVAAEATLEDHREAKASQYAKTSPLGLDIAYGGRLVTPARYVGRGVSARSRIEASWGRQLELDRVLQGVDPDEVLGLPLKVEDVWAKVPEELGELAFTPDHAYEIVGRYLRDPPPQIYDHISRIVESAYMDSYVQELSAGVVLDLVALASPYPLLRYPGSISFEAGMRSMQVLGSVGILDGPELDFIGEEASLRTEASPALGARSLPRATVRPPIPPMVGAGVAEAPPTIAILCALRHEAEAVRLILDDPQPMPGGHERDPGKYTAGWIRGLAPGARDVRVLLTQCIGMNNKNAAASVTRLGMTFESVSEIVMSGIAGAVPRIDVPDRDVGLGDVIVVERAGVIDLDHMTRTRDSTESRGALPPPSPKMLSAADVISDGFHDVVRGAIEAVQARDPRFERPSRDQDVLHGPEGKVLRDRGRAEMRLFRGLVGSSDQLVRDPVFRDAVGERHGVMGLEMESGGVATVAPQVGCQYMVIRSFVDYCDGHKNDVWHQYASLAAGAVATHLITLA